MKMEKWAIADKCVLQMCKLLCLSIVDGEVIENGKVLRWDECRCYEFPAAVTLPSGIKVDALLLFGDGTFEINEADNMGSYGWTDYSEEDMSYIYSFLSYE